MTTDRSGSTMGYHLAAVNAANLKRVLVPVVRPMPYWSTPPMIRCISRRSTATIVRSRTCYAASLVLPPRSWTDSLVVS